MGKDGMLIAPAPTEDGTDGEMSKDDLQEGLDWVQDLYNTLCVGMDEEKEDHDDGSHGDEE